MHAVDADGVVTSRRRHPLAGKTPCLGVARLQAPQARCTEPAVGMRCTVVPGMTVPGRARRA
ncbi:hypothetical protein BU14_2227s0002 [Porphyra umbilicalis]|uniref:Uncharacterized protein n=1 Tax=Porphyra umbilicalis TaxID=2786 RepID=A0A1X6NJL0_PORUM|nr:hypothetical protein BU14_2227s0002 [Porphyra umbilicalis]|eukprot:OSX68799.1 hypothetical protein BU14_2227s0002 [Porphyra umbilicalis]